MEGALERLELQTRPPISCRTQLVQFARKLILISAAERFESPSKWTAQHAGHFVGVDSVVGLPVFFSVTTLFLHFSDGSYGE